MYHSVLMLFTAAALAVGVFSPTPVAGTNDIPGFLGRLQYCVRPRHCGHLRHAGQTTSGVYTIYHNAAGPSGQRVYCDMETDGGDWTVIQRRGQFGNSMYYFYRNWTEYASGFGDVQKEYWIGNRALHALTSGEEQMSLRVVLNKSSSESVSIDYGRFKVASAEDLFRISVGDFKGTVGWDALTALNGRPFATLDNKSGNEHNCSGLYIGAWWYTSHCHGANLNGVNFNGKHFHSNCGIQWNGRGLQDTRDIGDFSYPSVLMMVRSAGGLRNRRRR